MKTSAEQSVCRSIARRAYHSTHQIIDFCSPKDKLVTTCTRTENGPRWQNEYSPELVLESKRRSRTFESTTTTVSVSATSSTAVGGNRPKRSKQTTSRTAPYSLDPSARKNKKIIDAKSHSTTKSTKSTTSGSKRRDPKTKKEVAPSSSSNIEGTYRSTISIPFH